jgi:hypothetical protein
MSFATPAGTWINGDRSGGPASIRTAEKPEAVSRSASTHPAEPAPTMTKSACIKNGHE